MQARNFTDSFPFSLKKTKPCGKKMSSVDSQLEYVSCLLCAKEDTTVFSRGAGSTQVVRCRNDGLLYRNPRPAPEVLKKFQTEFVPKAGLEWFARRQKVLKRYAESIQKIKSNGNLLDIGCATGNFFQNFSAPGWHLYGIDPSPVGAELARATYGAEVSCGTLRDVMFPAGFFDVVTVMDALYYSPDPRIELAEIRRILKKDGLLAVEIPGLMSFRLRDKGILCWLLNQKWVREFAVPGHLYYFSPGAIRILLRSTGFRLDKMCIGPSVSTSTMGQAAHEIYFLLAWLVFQATAGRVSIAGRELYLATNPCDPDQSIRD
jgi:SAM-dependent methyltransferase